MIVTDKLSTESFHAFIDEQLTDEQYVQVEAQLDAIPEKIEEIQQCHIVNERLREVFDPIVEEPLPEDLYDLAISGLERHTQEDFTQQEDDPISYLELEEDIAAIDAIDDVFPEVVAGESLVDDTDASDLEVLAQTEHLSDFDIDDLRSDPTNIIPDIFDDSEFDDSEFDESEIVTLEMDTPVPEGVEASHDIDPADDLLESIDELTIELEKAQEKKHAPDVIALPAEAEEPVDEANEALTDGLETENLELAPVEYEEESAALFDEPTGYEQQDEELETSSAQDQILETLTAEEELTLEPLEEQAEAAFIQETEVSEPESETTSESIKHSKQSRPRNLRATQTEVETNSPDIVGEQAAVQNELFQSQQDVTANQTGMEFESAGVDSGSEFQLQPGPSSEEVLPDDLVAEFFSEKKGPDFEVNEVVKQFEEVSQDFAAVAEDHLFDEGPVAGFKYKLQNFFDTGRAKLDQYKNIVNQKKSDLLAKFGAGGQATNFNKSPFEDSDFSQYSSKAPADTLDLSAFEDFAKEPSSNKAGIANEFAEDVATSESLASQSTPTTTPGEVHNDDLRNQGGPDMFQDFNNPPAAQVKTETQDQKIASQPNAKQVNSANLKAEAISEFTSPAASEFNFDMDLDDGSSGSNFVSKFGDTLKHYKQKITEMRASQAELGEESSTFEKYKDISARTLSSIRFKDNPALLAGAALVVGILVVSLLFTFGGSSTDSISNDRIDKLAIDTHLLNTQFNSKIIADADSAIIEKLQWFSARVGRKVRLADIRVEDFEFKKVSVLPTMASFAAANIFENKAGQRLTLLVIPDVESTAQAALSCRIPAEVDGLCVWVKDSVRYIAVANLSLSRVRSFSEQVIEKL